MNSMLAKIVVQCANPQFAKRIYIRASGLPRAGARLPPGFRRSWLQAPGYRVGIRYNKVLTIPFTGLQPRRGPSTPVKALNTLIS